MINAIDGGGGGSGGFDFCQQMHAGGCGTVSTSTMCGAALTQEASPDNLTNYCYDNTNINDATDSRDFLPLGPCGDHVQHWYDSLGTGINDEEADAWCRGDDVDIFSFRGEGPLQGYDFQDGPMWNGDEADIFCHAEVFQPGGSAHLRHRGRRTVNAKLRRFNKMKAQKVEVRHKTDLRKTLGFSVLHVNIRGFMSKVAELTARLRLLKSSPTLVCLNETFLDASTKEVELEGYVLVARRDRRDGRQCGGVAVFALASQADYVTLVKDSDTCERLWMMVHSHAGPHLICVWYRPPVQGEIATINSLRTEWQELQPSAIGTIIVGDLNIHHRKWLRKSARNTAEGEELRQFCVDFGMQQKVRKATREKYTLDLVITDVDGVKSKVLPPISDHSLVLAELDLEVPESQKRKRKVWKYGQADWDGLRKYFEQIDWGMIVTGDADTAALSFTDNVLAGARLYIPSKWIEEKKSSHPWLNDRVESMVKRKIDATGTPFARRAIEECSEVMKEEFAKYLEKEKTRLRKVRKGSKGWWSKSRRLLRQKAKICSIPALKTPTGEWLTDAKSKADHLACTFKSKYKLRVRETNAYTCIETSSYQQQRALEVITEDLAAKFLNLLKSDSATGPDELPSKIIKECAHVLAFPFCSLAKIILSQGRWPDMWMLHFIMPLYKKKSVYMAANYRGIHLTSQLSKAMERMIRSLFMPYLLKTVAYGPNQFAYTPEVGARDALAFMVLKWIIAFAKNRKVGIYCSDVSGAFDRVDTDRLVDKLKKKKIHPAIVEVLRSWLRNRRARVVVGGQASEDFTLANMVFQGTVLGPSLWNVFFEDARLAIQDLLFEEVIFADDLNAFREFTGTVTNAQIIDSCKGCQSELHAWGAANQVEFDAGKESFHVLSKSDGYGGDFKILGIIFDANLTMEAAITQLVIDCGWKLKMLLRTRRFYTDAELVMLYKAHLLSFIEYRTPAIYHACQKHLSKVDRIQAKLLADAGVGELDALTHFNLAPLSARRDIAMLGLIHRTFLRKGPKHFRDIFHPLHGNEFEDPRDTLGRNGLVQRSALGLLAIYNLLPGSVRAERTVKAFQGSLQRMMKDAANDGILDWRQLFSPRLGLNNHVLHIYGELWTCVV